MLVFLLIGSLTLVGCGERDKVVSNISVDEIINEEFKNPFEKEEKLRTAKEVQNEYTENRNKIISKKQIKFLEKENIDKDLVLKYAKNAVKIAHTNEKKKIYRLKDTIEKLVLVDDLQNNTTDKVKIEMALYLIDLWEEGVFEKEIKFDEQLRILYLSRYLDLALENEPLFNSADKIVHNMYRMIDDRISGKDKRIEKYKNNIEPFVESVKRELEDLQ